MSVEMGEREMVEFQNEMKEVSQVLDSLMNI
jgi:hypothetical protein